MELRHEGASRARTLIGNAVQEGAEAPHMAPGRQHTGKCRWLPATKDLGYRLSPRDWKSIHILLWEEHVGPIPIGHCVCFKDNNKQNVVIDNLELITRAERMRRNSIHRYPPELKSAIRVISKLKRTIQEVEHEKQD